MKIINIILSLYFITKGTVILSNNLQEGNIDKNCCYIYLVRHGQTDWNRLRKLQGHADIPLNSVGKLQASDLSMRLKPIKFNAIYSSQLIRAYETAEILNCNNIDIITIDNLKERNLGNWEGCAIDLAHNKEKEMGISNMNQHEFINYKLDESTESLSEVFNRLNNFIQDIKSKHLGQTILLSSHSAVLNSVLCNLNFEDGFRWSSDNCAFLVLKVDDSGNIVIIEQEKVKLVKL